VVEVVDLQLLHQILVVEVEPVVIEIHMLLKHQVELVVAQK
jgi:hypothetical protein